MKTKVTQKISMVLLSVFLFCAGLAPKSSSAAIGGTLTAGGYTAIVGIPLVFASLLGMILPGLEQFDLAAKPGMNPDEKMGHSIMGVALTGVGLLILDANNEAPILRFSRVDLAQGAKLGASPQEVESYNNDLDLIAALSEDLSQNLARVSGGDLKYATSEWRVALEKVAPLTRSMILKIAQRMADL